MPEVLEPPRNADRVATTEGEATQEVNTAGRMARFGRRRYLIALAVMALIAIVFFAIRYFTWSASHEETDDAYLQGHIHPVSSRVTGTVERVFVDDNQLVQAGQLLVQLDPRDYQVKLDQAEAALDVATHQAQAAQDTVRSTAQSATAQRTEANGTIGSAQAGIVTAREQVAVAKAGIARAQADLVKAQATQYREELDLHRYEDLLAKGQVSRQTLEHAREAYDVAVAATSAQQQVVSQSQGQELAAEQGITAAQAGLVRSQGELQAAAANGLEVNVRTADVSTAKASVAQATAAVEDAKLQLSYTRIVSPVAGRVARKSVEAGQRLGVGQALLAVVEDNPWIVANFKETQLERVRQGQQVEVHIDSFPHHAFVGRVDSIAPGSGNQFSLLPPDNATGNFTKIVQRIPVKIVFDGTSLRGFENLLVPGSSAVVTVTTRDGR